MAISAKRFKAQRKARARVIDLLGKIGLGRNQIYEMFIFFEPLRLRRNAYDRENAKRRAAEGKAGRS